MPEVDSETNSPHSKPSHTSSTSPSSITATTQLSNNTNDQRPFTAPPTPNLHDPLRPHSVPLGQQPHIPQFPATPQHIDSFATDRHRSPTMILNMMKQLPIKQSHYIPTIAPEKSTTRSDRYITDYTINTNTDRFGLRVAIDDDRSSTNNLQTPTKSWHPHIYAKPPKAPTPHSIGDILGLQKLSAASDTAPADLCCSTTTSTRSLITPIIGDRSSNVTISQILNAKSSSPQPVSDQLGNVNSRMSIGQYKRTEPELRFGSMRSGSMSEECSEDDGISDQPLNLSVTRSERRVSPVKSSVVSLDGGQHRPTTKTSKKGESIYILMLTC